MTTNIASEIIDRLGGPSAVARLCRCRPPSVSEWKRTGIPLARWLYLRAIRPDVVPEPPKPEQEAA